MGCIPCHSLLQECPCPSQVWTGSCVWSCQATADATCSALLRIARTKWKKIWEENKEVSPHQGPATMIYLGPCGRFLWRSLRAVLACLSAASDTADVIPSHAAHCYCFRVVPALLGSLHRPLSCHPSVHCASLHRSGLHLRFKILSGSHCPPGQLVPTAKNVGLRLNPDSQPLTLYPEAVHFPF